MFLKIKNGIKNEGLMDKLVITVKDLSQQLGISLPLAYKLIDSHNFPVVKIGRRKLIIVDELKNWLKSNIGNSIFADEENQCENSK